MTKLLTPLFLFLMAFIPANENIPDYLTKTADSTIAANGKKNGIWLMYKNKTNHPANKKDAMYLEKVYYDDDFLVSRSNKAAPFISEFRPADSLALSTKDHPALLNGLYEGIDHTGRVAVDYTYKDGILKLLNVYAYYDGTKNIKRIENFDLTYHDQPFTGRVEIITPTRSTRGYYRKVEKYHKWYIDFPFDYGDI